MSSSISFGGKCATVLIGAGLSWATVTNPNVDQDIGKLFGMRGGSLSSATADTPNVSFGPESDLDTPLIDVLATSPPMGTQEQPAANRRGPAILDTSAEVQEARDVQGMAAQLRSLGASYLILERLPQQTGDQFRARCDLAASGSSLKCCFEAVRNTPEQAMAEVLQAVVAAQARTAQQAQSAAPAASI